MNTCPINSENQFFRILVLLALLLAIYFRNIK
jgi:hypothetical protein